jgi:hypothetical protein
VIDLRVGDEEAMGWLSWSASVVHSLAWPVAAVVIAFIFRAQISGLLDKIRRLTWGDKVVDFAGELDQIEAAIRIDAPPRSEPSERSRPLLGDERFEALLAISPAAAILDAWVPTEMLIEELTEGLSPSGRRGRRSTSQHLDILVEAGVITQSVAALTRQLLALRNAAAHGGAVTAADAYRFRDLSDEMIDRLEEHLNERGPIGNEPPSAIS